MATPRVFALQLAGNQLLDRLPSHEPGWLRPHLEPVALTFDQVLYKAGETIRHVYFPTEAVVSLQAVMEDGTSAEVASMGSEGVVGLRVLLGAKSMPQRAIVQFPGQALRAPAEVLQDWAGRGDPLALRLSRYIGAFLTHVAQLSACNAFHPVRRRCCRWLLMAHDRIQADELPLTHQFLSQMLGVRRAGVTETVGPLQAKGLIRCSRGKVVILDRQGLLAASCECYRAIKAEYDRLLG